MIDVYEVFLCSLGIHGGEREGGKGVISRISTNPKVITPKSALMSRKLLRLHEGRERKWLGFSLPFHSSYDMYGTAYS